MVAVSRPPSTSAVAFRPRRFIRTDIFRDRRGREQVQLSQGGAKVQLAVSGASLLDAPCLLTELAIPDDRAGPRLAAIAAFNHLAQGGRGTVPSHVHGGASARLALVLQALDGHLAGASQRQIAVSLFGPKRVESGWRDSGNCMRDRVRRAVRRGRHMMDSGYLDLLQR